MAARRYPIPELSNVNERIIIQNMEKLFEILEKPDDQEEIFAKSVAVSLKKFDETNRALAMMKIQQVLYEITLKALAATPRVYQNLPAPVEIDPRNNHLAV
ncbi:unnamed protein product [Allacma fusca]|uniref:Uncharacterized protein n=1 Tax=Allacma fusca TaxID=39272 RepID=A0A8J2KQ82_9HEXA|nr:unnamed protein product [Allacma fusca]